LQPTNKMKFSRIAPLIAGLSYAFATPVLEKRADGVVISRDIEVIYKDCDVVTPKVFIISMVSHIFVFNLDLPTQLVLT
jgi:hypothetical protein